MQEIGALAYAMQRRTRGRIHVLRHTGTRAHEDGIVTRTEEAVDGDIVLTHHAVGDKLYTQRLNLAYLVAHHALRQSVFRNTVHQHAARLSLSFEDGNIETLAGEITSHGKTSRTRTDNRHAAARLLRQLLSGKVHLGIEVSDKLLQLTNLHRFSLLSQHTVSLALLLVRTNTSADGRQVALGVDDAHRSTHVTH